MDTITHSLVGALVGYTLQPDKKLSSSILSTKERVLCGAIVATFPDIDYVTALIDPLLFITYWHRGVTHSIIMLPIWSLMLGVVIALLLKSLNKWRYYAFISAIVLTSHILLDASTSWDLQIFAPLSDYRISLRYIFVIDPIFTGFIVLILVITYYFQSRWVSFLGLAGATIYIIMLSTFQQNAVKVAEEIATTQDWEYENITALPQPFSPFHWKLIVSDDMGHWLTFLNITADYSDQIKINKGESIFSIPKYYRSKDNLDWTYFSKFQGNVDAINIWNHPDFYEFRKFAHFPALSNVNTSNSELCYWFFDLRFYLPIISTPFQYGMCSNLSEEPNWLLYRIRNFSDYKKIRLK